VRVTRESPVPPCRAGGSGVMAARPESTGAVTVAGTGEGAGVESFAETAGRHGRAIMSAPAATRQPSAAATNTGTIPGRGGHDLALDDSRAPGPRWESDSAGVLTRFTSSRRGSAQAQTDQLRPHRMLRGHRGRPERLDDFVHRREAIGRLLGEHAVDRGREVTWAILHHLTQRPAQSRSSASS
jgi:hypothetical protein